MQSPATKEILTIWEKSKSRSLIEKTMDLLYASNNRNDKEDPAALSIGERDARLFRLREWMFGSQLFNIADCPACHERVEWITTTTELLSLNEEKKSSLSHVLDVDDYHIQYRLINSYELIKASSDPAYRADAKKIFSDCIIDVQKGEEPYNPDELPGYLYDKLDQQMAEEDSVADIRMMLNCPKCSHQWEMPFDIVSYLWIEIDSWAKHVLHEVAVLASSFGWSESDILNMGPRRRQLYLEMIKR
jgi:endogenous inhibitor of DNA gyrase (YacG/DUF329 family)